MAACTGNGAAHCCWIGGVECPYLEENMVEGRRWVCGLLRELDTWEKVYSSARYRRTAAARWFKKAHPGFGCGDWPQNIPEVMDAGIGLCCWGNN